MYNNPIDNFKLQKIVELKPSTLEELSARLNTLLKERFWYFKRELELDQANIDKYVSDFDWIFRELSYNLKQDAEFIDLFLSILRALIDRGNTLKALQLMDKTFGFNFLHKQWVESMFEQIYNSGDYLQVYDIAQLIYSRYKSIGLRFNSNEKDPEQDNWEKKGLICMYELASKFVEETEGIDESELFNRTSEVVRLSAFFKEYKKLRYEFERAIGETDSRHISPVCHFFMRLVNITYVFRDSIINAAPIEGYAFYNIITAQHTRPVAGNKIEHVIYVAEFFGLKPNNVLFLFEGAKKKLES